MILRRAFLISVCASALLALAPRPATALNAFAPEENKKTPYTIRADEMSFDDPAQMLIATGRVEVENNQTLLFADSLQYDLKNDVVTALGNVQIVQPTGEVLFTDFIELKDEMKNGFIQNIQMLLTDGARFAAREGHRIDGRKKLLTGATFSPCKICATGKDPLWQVRAHEIKHNEIEKTITYKDIWLEAAGVPVFYAPYMRTSDPSVKRKSGFLTPSYQTSSATGLGLKTPYYQVFNTHQDLVVTPMYFDKDGLLLSGEYRENMPAGKFRLAASGGDVERRTNFINERKMRWHLDGEGKTDINDHWRTSFNLDRASDNTYLRRYQFNYDDTITSQAQAEYFNGSSYGLVQGYYFQGLRPDDVEDQTAQVFPHLQYSTTTRNHALPGFFSLDAEHVNLVRRDGLDSQRLTLKTGWELPLYGIGGQVLNLKLSAQGDLYQLNDTLNDIENRYAINEDGWHNRAVPVASATWRWPFIRASTSGASHQIIEPIVAVVAAPNSSNNDLIPNEDSRAFEFDDTNLFSENRFPGVDRIASGQRVDYGVKLGHYTAEGTNANFFVGQSYQVEEDPVFTRGSGLEDNRSDMVGRAQFYRQDLFDVTYRFRFNTEDQTFRRNEVMWNTSIYPFRVNANYIEVNNSSLGGLDDRQEVSGTVLTKLNKEWFWRVGAVRDLENNTMRSWNSDLIYQNECLYFSFGINRDYTDDGETAQNETIGFVVSLKHISGDFDDYAQELR